jgi:glycosyltransferase involved in cell wall biosynthesis
VTEHQTIESVELKLNRNNLAVFFDRIFGKSIRKQSDVIIGVTDEITQYEITRTGNLEKPHLTIGNGFDAKSVPLKKTRSFDNNELHLLCVAKVGRWHGLDRILKGLAIYSGTPRVILHIAGNGSELSYLKKLANDLSITNQVVFHGFLTGNALNDLFDQCHIAVGSLGIHRIGLKEASTLKAREYCARGIPFIYGIPDLDFPEEFPFILHFPADDSPIDVEKVLAFAITISRDSDHPQKMRCYAEEHLDWSVKMKKLKDFLDTLVNENSGETILKVSI